MFRFISCALILALANGARSQPFGPYGFREFPEVAGFRLEADGFRVEFPGEPKVFWANEVRHTQWLAGNEATATFALVTTGPAPSKVRVNSFAPGFELYFERKCSLRFEKSKVPYLSWDEGSVGEEVPTPKVRWVSLSWPDDHVPLLISSLDEPVDWIVNPLDDGFELTPVDNSKPIGWIRISTPLGIRPFPTPGAAEMGRLALACTKQPGLRTLPGPRFQSLQCTDSVATFQFSANGSLTPLWAKGNLLPTSPTEDLAFPVPAGSKTMAQELQQRFSIPPRSFPLGTRAVVAQLTANPPAKTFDTIDSIVRGALSLAFSSASPVTVDALEKSESLFLESSPVQVDRVTGIRLPFKINGEGADYLAAYAFSRFLRGAERNPLWESLLWTQDLFSGDLTLGAKSTRSAEICAIAGAFSQSAEDRFRSLILTQAILDRNEPNPSWLDAFAESILKGSPNAWRAALNSPLRMIAGPRLFAYNAGGGYRLRWWSNQKGKATLTMVVPSEPRIVRSANETEVDWQPEQSYPDGSVLGKFVVKTAGKGETWFEIKPISGTFPALPKAPQGL